LEKRNDYNNNGYDDKIKLAALYQWVWNMMVVSTGMLV
jgi:hypothetical protein